MNGNNGRPKPPRVIGSHHGAPPPDPATIAIAVMVIFILCLSCLSLDAALLSVFLKGTP